MAIPSAGGKKRDRVEMMMTNPSSNSSPLSSFKRSSTHRSASAPNLSSKKKQSQHHQQQQHQQPPPQDTDPNNDDDAEYERAVAYLREFHSRRVAVTHLHSVSLESILEADSFEDVLAGDFALALSVGRSSAADAATDAEDGDADAERPRRMIGRTSPIVAQGLSRMKKTVAAKCLVDLDEDDDDDGCADASPSPTPSPFESIASFDDYGDFCFGHYIEDDMEAPPVTKRRRSILD